MTHNNVSRVECRLTFYSVKNSKAPKPTKRSREATNISIHPYNNHVCYIICIHY